tara:strand:- start:3179 stop:4504 length:1326 start_codon:yes stop_codon:yes gene_type:complete
MTVQSTPFKATGGMRQVVTLPKHSLWLFFIFIAPVLSDALYGLAQAFSIPLPFSPGIVLRSLIILSAAPIVVGALLKMNNRPVIWLAALVLSVIPSMFVSGVLGGDLVYDLSALSKSLYLPVITVLILFLLKRYPMPADDLLKAIEYSAYLYAFFLVVPGWLGLQVYTYGDFAYGSKGVFHAGNDASVTLGVSLIALGYRLIYVKFSITRLLTLTFCVYALTEIGSRAALIFILGSVLAVVIGSLVLKPPTQLRGFGGAAKRVLSGTSVVFLLAGLVGYGLTVQLESEYQRNKLYEIARGDVPRLALTQTGLQYLSERNTLLNFIGEGADKYERGVARFWHGRVHRMTEVDWLDALGRYGLLFAILSHCFVIVALRKAFLATLVKRDVMAFTAGSGLFLFLAHSVTAGHALYSPAPAAIAGAYLALIVFPKPPPRQNMSAA